MAHCFAHHELMKSKFVHNSNPHVRIRKQRRRSQNSRCGMETGANSPARDIISDQSLGGASFLSSTLPYPLIFAPRAVSIIIVHRAGNITKIFQYTTASHTWKRSERERQNGGRDHERLRRRSPDGLKGMRVICQVRQTAAVASHTLVA